MDVVRDPDFGDRDEVVTFGDLSIGDMFYMSGYLYMKTNYFDSAIDLTTGYIYQFSRMWDVTPAYDVFKTEKERGRLS